MNKDPNDRTLVNRLQQLPREIAPRHDPWPDIESQIASSARSGAKIPAPPGPYTGRWRGFALAATVVVTFAAGMLVGRQWLEEWSAPGTIDAVTLADPVAKPGEVVGANRIYQDSLAASEIVYQAAFREYIDVGQGAQLLGGATNDGIQKGWYDMRQTELALNSALDAHPGNPFLVGKMMDLRKRQLAFLQQLAGVDQLNRTISRSNAI